MTIRTTALAVMALLSSAAAFTTLPTGRSDVAVGRVSSALQAEPVELALDLPPSGSGLTVMMKIEPCLPAPSEMVVVRYKLPFGLNVEPRKNLAVCTKDGLGGEKEGDVLRYTSQWTLGLPKGDGLITTAAAFSGGISWGCTIFDVLKANEWEEVVEALTSNIPDRTDEVLLIFERPLESASEAK